MRWARNLIFSGDHPAHRDPARHRIALAMPKKGHLGSVCLV
jgi:hypothetical protein